MATRRERLEGLRIVSPCAASWEAMQGDGRRRHCLQCDRPVYDLAQLSAREIAGRIEASRGRLYVRVTRDAAGRLLTREPPAPPASRRFSPVAAAMVAAALGLGGAAWAGPAPAAAPAVEAGAGEPSGASRPQRAGRAGVSLAGSLATDGGTPIPDAEVRALNRIDGQEHLARTDAEGRFSFVPLSAGIYVVTASVRGWRVAEQADLVLRAGERRQVGLSVQSGQWQELLSGASMAIVAVSGGFTDDLLRASFARADLVILGVAGKSAVAGGDEDTQEVRTDVGISAVLKGDTRERVISVLHHVYPGDPRVLRPGDKVLAFLSPREGEDGRILEGYEAADRGYAFETVDGAETASYRERLEALARISRDGPASPAELVEWLVGSAEDPVTRGDAVRELSAALAQLESQAERLGVAAEEHARALRELYAEFLATGGRPAGEVDATMLAAFLTGAQRERLTAALLRTSAVREADLILYRMVRRWHEDGLLSWLVDQLPGADLAGGTGFFMMEEIAAGLEDERLEELLAAAEKPLADLEDRLYAAEGAAAEKRAAGKLTAAQEELRQRFLAALRGGH